MADAVSAYDRLEPDSLFQVTQFPFGAANLQAIAVSGDRDSRRVIAAVFKPLQAVEND
jgi:hypothetical protein